MSERDDYISDYFLKHIVPDRNLPFVYEKDRNIKEKKRMIVSLCMAKIVRNV